MSKDNEEIILVCHVNDSIESSTAIKALENENIKAMSKPTDVGSGIAGVSTLMGNNAFGYDIYVLESELEKSKDILIGIGALKEDNTSEYEDETETIIEESEESTKKRSFAFRFFETAAIIVLVSMLLMVYVVGVDKIIAFVKGFFAA